MSDRPLRVFDIETKLAADDDGGFRKGLIEQLNEELHGVKRAINAGLPPEEFQQAEQYAMALERAAAVVRKVWDNEHKSS